ncbi:MAG: hypothetical protein K8R59_17840 [Thermoanaerobaculales bacterium]|nr:hypothetical protein [Thermoanaerobaculales bacterium]
MSDRKYRHRGYQDDDDRHDQPQKPSRSRSGPRDYSEGPRGRGVGMPTEIAFKCARCGTEIKMVEIAPDLNCPSCNSALHSCTNCRYFSTGALFECRKPIEARIESKTKANKCTFFEPKVIRDLKSKRAAMEPDVGSPSDARSAFDALFKK